MAVPDRRATIEEVRRRWPKAFALCHANYGHQDGQQGRATRAQAELFVRLCAWACHTTDPAWGLNGKYGGTELSQDVLLYKLDATRRQGVDFVGNAGSSKAAIVWNVFEPSTDATGRWIAPREIPQAEIDTTLGVVTPPPVEEPGTQWFTFRTVHDTYLCAEKSSGKVVADRLEAKAWEHLGLDRTSQTHGRLRSSFNTALTAVKNALRCDGVDGTVFGIWLRDGKASLQLPDGQWVRVGSALEGYPVTCDGPWPDKNGVRATNPDGSLAPGDYETFAVDLVG